MMNKDFIELQSDVNRTGALFTSKKELTPDTVDQYISCSESDKTYVTNDSMIQFNIPPSAKSIGKTLNGDGVVEETMPVILNNIKHYRNIQCKMIPNKIKIFNDTKEIKANNLEHDNYVQNCCLNSTHSMRTFGLCSEPMSNLAKKHGNYIKEGKCNEKHNQNLVTFFRTGFCIFELGITASCSNHSRILDNCFSAPCVSKFQSIV